jgi:hypothetical protein
MYLKDRLGAIETVDIVCWRHYSTVLATAKRRPQHLSRNVRSCPAVPLYDATSLSGFAECRREWLVSGKADSARALLLDREFGSHINPAMDVPGRAPLTE